MFLSRRGKTVERSVLGRSSLGTSRAVVVARALPVLVSANMFSTSNEAPLFMTVIRRALGISRSEDNLSRKVLISGKGA
jgi:hypothetical protein